MQRIFAETIRIMKLVIFGATGFSGKKILAEALQRGHEVTVLARNSGSIAINHPRLTILEGSVLDPSTVANVLRGQEAVIQCLGVGGKGDGKPTTFVSDATLLITEEMKKAGIQRLIAMSNVGAGNSIAFHPRIFTKWILPYFMKWLQVIIDDKNRMETLIMNTSLQWTIARFPNIVDKPGKGRYTISLDGKGLTLSITLADMAACLIDFLQDGTYTAQAPSISN